MIIISLLLLGSLLPHLSFSASVNVGIVNGSEARPHSRPYMVSIQEDKSHICGGFLISDQFVMTAAHCRSNTETLTVVAGANDLSKSEETVRINVDSYEKHPSYKQDTAKSNEGDIMILKLEKKVELNENIKTIPIPTKPEEIKVDTVCSVAGWGRLENNERSSKLMEADVKIMNKTLCKKPWGNLYVASKMMCVHGHGGSCKGDSGGPLVCEKTAVGVTSFSRKNKCNDSYRPNVYTEISAFLEWIQNVTKS